MKKIFLIVTLTIVLNPIYASHALVYNIYGQLVNCSGKAQPLLTQFFGVEVGVTSFNVSKAILEERYGTPDYVSQSGDSWCLKFNRVFWYDFPVKAYFFFENINGKRILTSISIICGQATVMSISDILNQAYGECKDKSDGYWGLSHSGYYAICVESYYDYKNSRLVYRGFSIH